MKTQSLILTTLLMMSSMLQAALKPAPLLTDNMVLQRNAEVKLWGTAKANEKITVVTSWNKARYSTTSNSNGEWTVKVLTTEAGGPYTIALASLTEKATLKNILLGEVWLCSGQSNMEMTLSGFTDSPINGAFDALMQADNSNIRLFTVKRAAIASPQDTCSGSWEVSTAETAARFSAVGYFYAMQLQKALHVPIGMICSSWGGSRIEAWINKETMADFPDALKRTTQEKTWQHHRASNLYNGMIHPLVNYKIKGAIWYQGESNRSEYFDYAALMNGMVSSWRKEFDAGEFPFYFVQIAPHAYNDNKSRLSAKFCDEQLSAATLIPNSGMVVTTDLGDERNIHPAEKNTVAKRLSAWALAETYRLKGIPHKNTCYKSVEVADSTLIVSFDNTDMGISVCGKTLSDFEIAGDDKVFFPATAWLRFGKKQVVVMAPQVKHPVAVRYRYCNYPSGNGLLYNLWGLPVPSFRSDDWKD